MAELQDNLLIFRYFPYSDFILQTPAALAAVIGVERILRAAFGAALYAFDSRRLIFKIFDLQLRLFDLVDQLLIFVIRNRAQLRKNSFSKLRVLLIQYSLRTASSARQPYARTVSYCLRNHSEISAYHPEYSYSCPPVPRPCLFFISILHLSAYEY